MYKNLRDTHTTFTMKEARDCYETKYQICRAALHHK